MSELPTKSELMEELKRDAEVIRKHFPNSHCVTVNDSGNVLCLSLLHKLGGRDIGGKNWGYRPEIQPPAKWEPVFFMYKGALCYGLSSGEISDSCLLVLFADSEVFAEHWCDINNRDHHSAGWRKGWEPEDV